MKSKILNLAEELVHSFTATPSLADSSGNSSAAGRSYRLTPGFKAELERHLERAAQGADLREITTELLKSLGKVSAESPTELVAGELEPRHVGDVRVRIVGGAIFVAPYPDEGSGRIGAGRGEESVPRLVGQCFGAAVSPGGFMDPALH